MAPHRAGSSALLDAGAAMQGSLMELRRGVDCHSCFPWEKTQQATCEGNSTANHRSSTCISMLDAGGHVPCRSDPGSRRLQEQPADRAHTSCHPMRIVTADETGLLKVRPPFLFFTLVTGPRRSLSLKLSDTRVYEPQIRARLGTTAHFCEVVVRTTLPPRRHRSHRVQRRGWRERDPHPLRFWLWF